VYKIFIRIRCYCGKSNKGYRKGYADITEATEDELAKIISFMILIEFYSVPRYLQKRMIDFINLCYYEKDNRKIFRNPVGIIEITK